MATTYKTIEIKSKDKKENMCEEEIKKEEFLRKRSTDISVLFKNATTKNDFDFILRKFNIKCIRNNKKLSPIPLKNEIKYKIIKMAIEEPEDVFNYDYYSKLLLQKEKTIP